MGIIQNDKKKTLLTMIQTEINVNLADIAFFSCRFDCLKNKPS
jgi:hypothetical protein